jgi:hypothetical protein
MSAFFERRLPPRVALRRAVKNGIAVFPCVPANQKWTVRALRDVLCSARKFFAADKNGTAPAI